jgi:hypothetical protein
LEKHGFPCFCRVFEDSAGQSRYRYQIMPLNLFENSNPRFDFVRRAAFLKIPPDNPGISKGLYMT